MNEHDKKHINALLDHVGTMAGEYYQLEQEHLRVRARSEQLERENARLRQQNDHMRQLHQAAVMHLDSYAYALEESWVPTGGAGDVRRLIDRIGALGGVFTAAEVSEQLANAEARESAVHLDSLAEVGQ